MIWSNLQSLKHSGEDSGISDSCWAPVTWGASSTALLQGDVHTPPMFILGTIVGGSNFVCVPVTAQQPSTLKWFECKTALVPFMRLVYIGLCSLFRESTLGSDNVVQIIMRINCPPLTGSRVSCSCLWRRHQEWGRSGRWPGTRDTFQNTEATHRVSQTTSNEQYLKEIQNPPCDSLTGKQQVLSPFSRAVVGSWIQAQCARSPYGLLLSTWILPRPQVITHRLAPVFSRQLTYLEIIYGQWKAVIGHQVTVLPFLFVFSVFYFLSH